MAKYFAKSCELDGIKFASKKEAARYAELKLLEQVGEIKNLELQPSFEIIPKQKHQGKAIRAAKYTADFKYEEKGEKIVEEVKGFVTVDYVLRKKLFILNYGDKYKFIES